MSDGSVIFSHSDLLDPHRHSVTVGVKTKTRPNTGREFDSRGSTRFMSYDKSLRASNGAIRFP